MMDTETRRKILQGFRAERESTNTPLVNPVGEASGRTWVPIPPDLLQSGRQAEGVEGFVASFSLMLDHSPVVVRPGEWIVGDYYYSLPYEIIPMEPPFDLSPYVARGALPVVPSGHSVANLVEGLRLGWGGIARKIEASLEDFAPGSSQHAYLRGARAVVARIQAHILAYAAEAERQSCAAGDPDQQAELGEIARRCRRLSAQPPLGLHDALQWYFFFVTFERSTASGMGSLRLDQVFWPYYQRDRQAGGLEDGQAQLLFECLFMKCPLFCSLGGVTPAGEDAVNPLTYLILAAAGQAGGANNLAARWHPLNPPEYRAASLDLLSRLGSGTPSMVNDEVIIPSLLSFGYPSELARDYCFAGCFWYVVPGKEFTYHDLAAVSGARALLAAVEEVSQDDRATYAALWAAYCRRLEDAVDALIEAYARIDPWLAGHYPEMVVSLLMDGCIERGLDFNNSGPQYNLMTVLFIGLANVADSLYAIRRVVFEQGEVSLAQVAVALRADFEGCESLRWRLRSCPKFGNAQGEVDQVAVEVAGQFKEALRRRRNPKGSALRPAFYSWHRQTFEGSVLGATPDGRRAGEPLAHGGNPSHLLATSGVTASIRSMARIGYADTAGCPFHLHLQGEHSAEFVELARALVETSFRLGAPHVILNRVDGALLWDAIAHPEQYHDLVIRVTGYSARFTSLERKYQEEIARRNSYALPA